MNSIVWEFEFWPPDFLHRKTLHHIQLHLQKSTHHHHLPSSSAVIHRLPPAAALAIRLPTTTTLLSIRIPTVRLRFSRLQQKVLNLGFESSGVAHSIKNTQP
ncbi:hypothetical protein E3N88_39583 [Mikania micrantha]|uniref:Uncharacterized protein n=1 Tax=Mikania micrantha TaxID=192012 RepID=A0A5N6LX72_9ASTR|nr:hypothetical protein E3N88_39583 [Mikania micrantha]